MELNICLYCETRLLDDSLSFCSSTCQANEAAKLPPTINIPASPAPTSISYEMSYHRRRSLSGGPRSHSSLVLSSSFVSDTSSSFSDVATP